MYGAGLRGSKKFWEPRMGLKKHLSCKKGKKLGGRGGRGPKVVRRSRAKRGKGGKFRRRKTAGETEQLGGPTNRGMRTRGVQILSKKAWKEDQVWRRWGKKRVRTRGEG